MFHNRTKYLGGRKETHWDTYPQKECKIEVFRVTVEYRVFLVGFFVFWGEVLVRFGALHGAGLGEMLCRAQAWFLSVPVA